MGERNRGFLIFLTQLCISLQRCARIVVEFEGAGYGILTASVVAGALDLYDISRFIGRLFSFPLSSC
jgi:hypothetical protein